MLIGVISDTHIPTKAKALPALVLEYLSRADHIVHAGDINDRAVIAELEKLAPVTAVYGNTDTAEAKARLREKELLKVGRLTIGIHHGHGDRGTTLRRALGSFDGAAVDCIIFGHSHIPYCGYHDGILLFNPGSSTDKRRNPYYSFGLLEIGGEIKARHVFFDRAGRIVG